MFIFNTNEQKSVNKYKNEKKNNLISFKLKSWKKIMESHFESQRFYTTKKNFCLQHYEKNKMTNHQTYVTNVTYYRYKCELVDQTIYYGFSDGLLVEVIDCPLYDYKQRWTFDIVFDKNFLDDHHMEKLEIFSYKIQIQNHHNIFRLGDGDSKTIHCPRDISQINKKDCSEIAQCVMSLMLVSFFRIVNIEDHMYFPYLLLGCVRGTLILFPCIQNTYCSLVDRL